MTGVPAQRVRHGQPAKEFGKLPSVALIRPDDDTQSLEKFRRRPGRSLS